MTATSNDDSIRSHINMTSGIRVDIDAPKFALNQPNVSPSFGSEVCL